MRPDLPETYYLDNLQTLFAHVENVYSDLLDPTQIHFLHQFAALKPNAQKLYTRLLNRSHDYYRASKLHYAEIERIEQAIAELEESGCIKLNEAISLETLFSLFTKAELLAARHQVGPHQVGPHQAESNQTGPHQAGPHQVGPHLAEPNKPAAKKIRLEKLSREDLLTTLLDEASETLRSQLAASDDFLLLQHRDCYQQMQMLFFGNMNQSMTSFVLRDLGLHQFEDYPIDIQNRPYQTRLEIAQHWLLHQLAETFALSEIKDSTKLNQLTQAIPCDIDPLAPAHRRAERLRLDVARQFERNGDLQAALHLYHQCSSPPSRERVARILDRQANHQASLKLCAEMIEHPLDETEIQFASSFAIRLCKRHRLEPDDAFCQQHITHHPEIIDLELTLQPSVETAVAQHYQQQQSGNQCFYLENNLFNGVLGLLFWEAIFAPLPGAFFNPFQHRPSDFYAHDFCQRRGQKIKQVWTSISSNDDIKAIVFERWDQKHGRMNPLVNWQSLNLKLIELALERIDHRHWRAIFTRILLDLRHNRAGFPDLIFFPSDGGYRLIEVKGPGDSLQKNQARWMQYFNQQQIPHCLARVKWHTE